MRWLRQAVGKRTEVRSYPNRSYGDGVNAETNASAQVSGHEIRTGDAADEVGLRERDDVVCELTQAAEEKQT